MSDDERKRTAQLRGVEIDALLRTDDPAEQVSPLDATAQIRPADLARLEAAASETSLPRTERNEAVPEAMEHATETFGQFVRPTQQSGQLRAVLDQDLREVPVEPIGEKFNARSHDAGAVQAAALRESSELKQIAASEGPITEQFGEDQMNTLVLPVQPAVDPRTLPYAQIKPPPADPLSEPESPPPVSAKSFGPLHVLLALMAVAFVVAALAMGLLVLSAAR